MVGARGGKLVAIRLNSSKAPAGAREDRAALKPFLAKLERYFRGENVSFDEPLELEVTPFARKVLEAARRIPYGETRTYGEVAAAAGSPGGARAVGRVMGVNPVPLAVP
jgi:AraC family transcriptional regulator of adaptative response/methylated-DNA-[protein]-cysteine methyltransferase